MDDQALLSKVPVKFFFSFSATIYGETRLSKTLKARRLKFTPKKPSTLSPKINPEVFDVYQTYQRKSVRNRMANR